MKKNFILITLLLFIFINKVQAEEFLDFSKNEILLSDENYIVIGNIGRDFKSIKYNADEYCSNNLGDNYKSLSIKISENIAYAYCVIPNKVDEVLDRFDLTNLEKDCVYYLLDSMDLLYEKYCNSINRNFETVIKEINEYRGEIKLLGSNTFVYEILNEDLAKKMSNFEKKARLYKQNQESEQALYSLQNPLREQIDTLIVNRNIKLCKLYKFVEGSELYFKCVLTLIKNQDTKAFFGMGEFMEDFKTFSDMFSKKNKIEKRLTELKQLFDDNLISEEEYEQLRKKIIGDV